MDAAPVVAPEVPASLPPEVLALIAWQARQIELLSARVAELEAKLEALGKNSTNSSQPPSLTHPHAKPPLAKPKSRRPRGGQPGHDQHLRELIPTAQCVAVVPCVPAQCRRCGKALCGVDPEPLRQQVWELPDIQPLVTEYQPTGQENSEERICSGWAAESLVGNWRRVA